MVATDLARRQGIAARQGTDAAEPKDDMRPIHFNRRERQPHGFQNVIDLRLVADGVRVLGWDVGGAGDDLAADRIEDADAAVPVHEVDHLVSGRGHEFGVIEHHMRTLGSADEAGLVPEAAIGEIDPGARGVDDDPRSHFAGLAGDLVAQNDSTARGALQPDVVQRTRLGKRGFRVLGQFEAQPFRIRDPRVVVGRGAKHLGVQRRPQRERRASEAEPVSWHRGFAAGQKVVKRQAGLDEQRASISRFCGPPQQIADGRNHAGRPIENRNRRGKRLDAVRRVAQQPVSLPERLPHQAEFRVLQIPETAVNHARHGGARPGAEIGFVDQQGVDSLQRQLAQQADAVDAAAYDQDGDVGVFTERSEFWAHAGWEHSKTMTASPKPVRGRLRKKTR